MIPKIIHYCWFGGNPLPELAQKCIASWKEFCPDYEIREWNESNYDFRKCTYMADAYKEKKWGFVPDYARLDIIYTHGGIYLDTDVEIIRPLDDLLQNKGIIAFESEKYVGLGLIIAGEKQLPLVKDLLESYERLSFYNPDGSLNLMPSPVHDTQILVKHGLVQNNTLQTIEDVTVFPSEYFCPKDNHTGVLKITSNTYTIHHYDGSWLEDWQVQIKQFSYEMHEKKMPILFKKLVIKLYLIYILFQHYGFRKGLNVCLNMIKTK